MALIRVAQYSSTPGPVTDYQAQNAHLQAFTNQLMTQQFILDAGTAQPVIKQGCYVSHGGSLYVADADTAITGSPSDGSVYIRVSGTTSLTVEFVTDISGYAWNPVYSALTSTTYTLLPYLIVKASTVWTRYNFNPNNQSFGDTRLNSLAVLNNATIGGTLGVTGAISGASINTGYGDNNVYKSSNEEININTGVDTDYNISPMSVGETRMVYIRLVYTGSTGGLRLNTPIDGSIYYTLTVLKSGDSGYGDLTSKLANNTFIVRTSQAGDQDITGMIIIKRIS
jgi:hypothetical protein